MVITTPPPESYLALYSGSDELAGGGYYRPLIYFTHSGNEWINTSSIDFQRTTSSWSSINGVALFSDRALTQYWAAGDFDPPISLDPQDMLSIPPGSLVLTIPTDGMDYLNPGSMTASGYITRGNATWLERIPFHPVENVRIHTL